MNRNTEMHFKNTPNITIRRSRFEESHSHKTTFNAGDIIPIYVDCDILPGDSVQMDMAELVRMATPIYPIMDNLYMDTYFFFVPHRLVYEHWAEFWGENDDPWIQTTEYEIPQITAPSGGWTEGTIADYMGIPTKINNISVNALPFRAYAKVWNDWFRDENLKKCCNIYKDETTRQGSNGTDYVTDVEKGGKPAKAAKLHDYFTSCLPAPQKGPAVEIPLGSGTIPVTGTVYSKISDRHAGIAGEIPVRTVDHVTAGTGSIGLQLSGSGSMGTNGNWRTLAYINKDNVASLTNSGMLAGRVINNTDFDTNGSMNVKPVNLAAVGGLDNEIVSNTVNLSAQLANATAMTISALRLAFAVQKYYENAGLHGTRYIEYIRSVFGVTSSDARMQRAEYLGGSRIPLNISQIIQTSSTDQTTPQGNAAGFSCTINSDSLFTKSFEEHGTLLGLAVVRVEHSYQQGLNKMWTRKKWHDFYNPFFAHLSEAPVNNEQIYAQGTTKDKEVFGYQEAWAEYRYKENRCSGYMRSNATGTLDVWHFADKYTALPILGTTWIDEPYENVDRTIAVTSQLTHQFIADFYFKTYYTRPMPVYSVPGLIDHV